MALTPDEVAAIDDPVARLLAIMALLRSPGGCPWDREQTLRTLKPYLIEESYEVLEAIDSGNPEELRGELGDLLLQIVFQSQLAAEQGWFSFQDVAQAITRKLIRRHPHVFGEGTANSAGEVLKIWEQTKKEEGNSLLQGIPRGLPALQKAARMGQKAARVGFDWPDVGGLVDKVAEEAGELATAADEQERFHELGDLLFALANLARHLKIEPELALQAANDRFRSRFGHMERAAGTRPLDSFTPTELEALWEEAKRDERSAR